MKLSDSNSYYIYLIGAGATGSHLCAFLAQLLNKFNDNVLKIIDGDFYETDKNMLNQKCIEKDNNKKKAEVLADRYTRIYKNLKVSFIDQYIKSPDELVETIVSEMHEHRNGYIPIIIGCVDNNATRKILHQVFYSEYIKDIIYIDSGNGSTNRIGQVIVGFRTGEVEERVRNQNYSYIYKPKVFLKPAGDLFPDILNDNDDINKLLSCNYINQDEPQNIATNVMAAATIFAIVNNIIAFNEITTHQHFFSVNTEAVEIISKKVE